MKTLRTYMAEKEISNKQAAAEIGCAERTIVMWRKRKHVPSPEFMDRIKEWSNGEVTADSFYS